MTTLWTPFPGDVVPLAGKSGIAALQTGELAVAADSYQTVSQLLPLHSKDKKDKKDKEQSRGRS